MANQFSEPRKNRSPKPAKPNASHEQTTSQTEFYGTLPGLTFGGRRSLSTEEAGSNLSKPFSWNPTLPSAGSSGSSEKSVVVLDDQSLEEKGNHRLVADCVLIHPFTPHPDEEYFINWAEFELHSLKRFTQPAGRVEYHVVYKDGHTAVYSPAEIHNHVPPKAVERLENTYFELELNPETYYNADDPEFPAGAPSGGTLLFNERGMPGMLQDKRKKRPRGRPSGRMRMEEQHRQRTARLRAVPLENNYGDSSTELETSTTTTPKGESSMELDTSATTSRSSPIKSSILERALEAVGQNTPLATGVWRKPPEIMDVDINHEVSVQLLQESTSRIKSTNTKNASRRASVIPVGTPRKSKMATELPEEIATNYIAPFDDEEDEDFMPDPSLRRPAKRVKSTTKSKQPTVPVSKHTSNYKPPPQVARSQLTLKSPEPTVASTTQGALPSSLGIKSQSKAEQNIRQVPLTAMWKFFTTAPNAAEKIAHKTNSTVHSPPRSTQVRSVATSTFTPKTTAQLKGKIDRPSTPILATLSGSPTELTKSLFPSPTLPSKFSNKRPETLSDSKVRSPLSNDNLLSLLRTEPLSTKPKTIRPMSVEQSRPISIDLDQDDISDSSMPDAYDSSDDQQKKWSTATKRRPPSVIEIDSEDEGKDDGNAACEPAKEYAVERILAFRRIGGKKYYLTKWLGYPEEQSTWEIEDNFAGSRELIEDFERRRLRGG